jgi:DNA-binding CsgD family transcriptional regulator
MPRCDEENLTAALEIIRVANLQLDADQLRKDAIKAIHKAFKSHSCNFFLIDQHSKLIDPIGVNLEQHYLSIYQSHFFRFNPFDPINLQRPSKATLTDEELFSLPDFLKTEYFNDFLKPQEVYRQMVVYLRSRGKLLGFIGLHRRKNSAGFGKREVTIGELIAPHLTSALEKAEMFRFVKEKEGLFRAVCDNTSVGMVILDASMRAIYANEKAVEICARITREGFQLSQQAGECVPLPAFLYDDCAELARNLRDFPNTLKPLNKERTIANSSTGKCVVRCEVLHRNLEDNKSQPFLITIQEISDIRGIGGERLKEEFCLSKREIEIVKYIFKGFTNSEIGKMLYISEGTVKNHMKKIFEKMGVQNRTSLIYEALAV